MQAVTKIAPMNPRAVDHKSIITGKAPFGGLFYFFNFYFSKVPGSFKVKPLFIRLPLYNIINQKQLTMRSSFKAIAIGILVGALIYFIPFRFPLLLFILLFFVFGRFFFRPWRGGYGWRRNGYDYRNDILPIDGYHRPSTTRNSEPEKKINIQ
jgi:hypothetical protein